MMQQNEIEEIIRLLNNGFDVEIISLELDVPIEEIKKCKKQLELRKYAKESIASGSQEECETYEKDKEEVIPKDYQPLIEKYKSEIDTANKIIDEEVEKAIKNGTYGRKEKSNELSKNETRVLIKRNLLTYAYFMAGKIEESRNELMGLIENGNYTAYRQLIHLEKEEENYQDAKLWAYDALERFPESIRLRDQLIDIAKKEGDNKEVIKQLREIVKINPNNEQNCNKLQVAMR